MVAEFLRARHGNIRSRERETRARRKSPKHVGNSRGESAEAEPAAGNYRVLPETVGLDPIGSVSSQPRLRPISHPNWATPKEQPVGWAWREGTRRPALRDGAQVWLCPSAVLLCGV